MIVSIASRWCIVRRRIIVARIFYTHPDVKRKFFVLHTSFCQPVCLGCARFAGQNFPIFNGVFTFPPAYSYDDPETCKYKMRIYGLRTSIRPRMFRKTKQNNNFKGKIDNCVGTTSCGILVSKRRS